MVCRLSVEGAISNKRDHLRGQTRDVHVYRLVGAGTLEELIYTRRRLPLYECEFD